MESFGGRKMPSVNRKARRDPRRAAVAVQVTLSLTFIFGFAALVVDIGRVRTTQTELQVAADSAALAAATEIGRGDDPVAAANQYAQLNSPKGYQVEVVSSDVETGSAPYSDGGKYVFTPGGDVSNAVRVTVRHTVGGGLIHVSYLFAPVLNFSGKNVEASATAMLVPRDISCVMDVSNSMHYDSSLIATYVNRTDGGYSNLRDVWCALNGPEPARPYVPADAASVDQTEYQTDTGPTYGAMTTWGSPLVPNVYNKTTDAGLWYIPKSANCTQAAAITSLTTRGYSAAERTALLSGSKDGTSYQFANRVKVILGLCTWHSGKVGGKAPAGGNGDDYVQTSELTVDVPVPSFARTWTWDTYIGGTQTSGYSYRYGLKTLVDYMMGDSGQPRNSQTDVLWQTPEQPIRALKDALLSMTDFIIEQQSLDQMSLELFCGPGSATRHEVDLTADVQQVPDTFYQRQAGHYDIYTNMGGGLYWGVHELTSARARSTAAKVIVMMSDGFPNRWDTRSSLQPYIDQVDDPNNNHSWSDEYSYAIAMAEIAAFNRIRIYCISVGSSTDRTVMQQIAEIGNGEEFYAHGNPEEYTAQLRDVFRTIAGRHPVALIE
jgi:Flp pilus assembly protein TadG